MWKADLWDLLGGLAGESVDRRNEKIGSTTNEKKCLTREKDHTKPNGQSLVPQDIGRGRREIKSLNGYAD